jgi:hypothetical protein
MSQRLFSLVTGAIFACIALLHLLRIFFGWEAMIGGWVVPAWLSWVALPIAAYLAYEGFRVRRSSR